MLSRLFLINNGKCCGIGCFMCPYEPKNHRNSTTIREEVLLVCSKEELDLIESK
jgi:hypothetical protein